MLLNKGIEKLERDLDIVELLEIIHGFRVMKKTLFTKDERFLLRHQRANAIHSASDSKSDDDLLNMNKQNRLEALSMSQKERENRSQSLRSLLNRFEKRKLDNKELRVLQAVLSQDFAVMEH